MRRDLALCLLLFTAACGGAPGSGEVRTPEAARLPALDSTLPRPDNTLAFGLPDGGGFTANGEAIAQEDIPAQLAAFFANRPEGARAVVVWDNALRRADAQWLARAARMAGGAAYDAELSGWPAPVAGAP
ncbi:MAG: hypothetical protein IPI38_19395 [Gemmatimonadetes bacterium]|jgi:hypothetical protein|nr:hypothetical protein [Gemmatimonadota bacterium]MBP6670761.1 hypothetical protein [Gemmatimonadales bacterium]MBK6779947.1 hypothetical protein [Gemmatimonadota bacterium]MBK7717536.1 hypothetical protein [Gemmatimonadota bacterium]MBK7922208.1 hypothetical protein [Gemmatimonadota bacterium]